MAAAAKAGRGHGTGRSCGGEMRSSSSSNWWRTLTTGPSSRLALVLVQVVLPRRLLGLAVLARAVEAGAPCGEWAVSEGVGTVDAGKDDGLTNDPPPPTRPIPPPRALVLARPTHLIDGDEVGGWVGLGKHAMDCLSAANVHTPVRQSNRSTD